MGKYKLHTSELYLTHNKAIQKKQTSYLERLYVFNNTHPTEQNKRDVLLKKMFAEIGEGSYIEPPLHATFGGAHVHLGKSVFANFNLSLIDDTHIYIGDYTMLGPNVTITTAGHPILPELRKNGYQFNAPVYIGKNCWLGAGVIVLPGITIGDNTVIGAGSIVTKNIPANVIAVGNPCKVLRKIGPHDKQYYWKDKKIQFEQLI